MISNAERMETLMVAAAHLAVGALALSTPPKLYQRALGHLRYMARQLYTLPTRLRIEYRMLTRPVAEVAGVRVRLGRHLGLQIRDHLCRGIYELPELRILRSTLVPEDIVMELGTGIGVLSSWCAMKIGSGRVFTYEGNPALEPYIRETFELNGVSPSLRMCVLGEIEGTRAFYVEKNFWSSSTLRFSRNANAVQVPVRPLNEEVRRVEPTMLVVDIEGGEAELFEFIDFHRIEKVCVEVHEWAIGPDQVSRVKARLLNAGFSTKHELCTENVLFFQRPELREKDAQHETTMRI